jgi:hypothetical protein
MPVKTPVELPIVATAPDDEDHVPPENDPARVVDEPTQTVELPEMEPGVDDTDTVSVAGGQPEGSV